MDFPSLVGFDTAAPSKDRRAEPVNESIEGSRPFEAHFDERSGAVDAEGDGSARGERDAAGAEEQAEPQTQEKADASATAATAPVGEPKQSTPPDAEGAAEGEAVLPAGRSVQEAALAAAQSLDGADGEATGRVESEENSQEPGRGPKEGEGRAFPPAAPGEALTKTAEEAVPAEERAAVAAAATSGEGRGLGQNAQAEAGLRSSPSEISPAAQSAQTTGAQNETRSAERGADQAAQPALDRRADPETLKAQEGQAAKAETASAAVDAQPLLGDGPIDPDAKEMPEERVAQATPLPSQGAETGRSDASLLEAAAANGDAAEAVAEKREARAGERSGEKGEARIGPAGADRAAPRSGSDGAAGDGAQNGGAFASNTPAAAALQAGAASDPGLFEEALGETAAAQPGLSGAARIEQASSPVGAATSAAAAAAVRGGAVAEQIGAAVLARGDDRRIVLQLDPQELGRVAIELTFADEGLSVSVRAERAEALDLMRRHADDLERQLREAGLDFDSLSFGAEGGREGGEDGEASSARDGFAYRGGASIAAEESSQTLQSAAALAGANAGWAGGVDLRV